MSFSSASKQVSSKEIMARTGISRATLNNYIGLNLIPPPTVRRPEEPGGPTKIGYFPEWVVERIMEIQLLKREGMRMSQIVLHFMGEEREVLTTAADPKPDLPYPWIEQTAIPAVLVDRDWNITSLNDPAVDLFFDEQIHKVPSLIQQNLFGPFFIGNIQRHFVNWKEIILAHMRVAKGDLTEESLQHLHLKTEVHSRNEVKRLWFEAEPPLDYPFTQQKLILKHHNGKSKHCTLFSNVGREGTLLLYTPARMQLSYIFDLLTTSDKLVKSLLSRGTPSHTPLAILAARLESELHLRSTLPPTEYFDLMNQFVSTSHQCCKDHGGIPGRTSQESIVCFFLAEPDSQQDYLFRPLICGQSMQKMARTLDKHWKYKQAWSNTLRLNIAVHSGHEWLGTIPSPLAFEFTVLGDTLMETVRLGEFCQGGSIWASKKVIENLSSAHRERVEFGIRLGVYQEQLVTPNIYSPVGELLSQSELEHRGLQEISNMVVTEIMDLLP